MRILFLKSKVFLKIHVSSAPNHNFREVFSGDNAILEKSFIENFRTSLVLKGLYQEKKSFSSSLFAAFRASIVREDIQKKQEK